MTDTVTDRRTLLAGLLGLAGCAATPGGPAGDPGGLPPSPAGLGLQPGTDLVLSALLNAASGFAAPASRIGPNPARAARLSGMVEYLTAMIIAEPRFRDLPALVPLRLAAGRQELRATLGLGEAVAPQAAITALAGAGAALDRGDRAGAAASLAPVAADPGRTLETLAALPAMPVLAAALAKASDAWHRDRGRLLFISHGVGLF